MAHLHDLESENVVFTLDADLNVTYDGRLKPLRRDDHASRIYSFVMPRHCKGHDMSLCNKVEVHYNNYYATRYERIENCSYDEVENFRVLEDDKQKVGFEWRIKGDATQIVGNISFSIKFACMNGDIVEYQKFSGKCEDLVVTEIVHNKDRLVRQYSDILEGLVQKVESAISNAGGINSILLRGSVESDAFTPEEAYDFEEVKGGILSGNRTVLVYSKANVNHIALPCVVSNEQIKFSDSMLGSSINYNSDNTWSMG